MNSFEYQARYRSMLNTWVIGIRHGLVEIVFFIYEIDNFINYNAKTNKELYILNSFVI